MGGSIQYEAPPPPPTYGIKKPKPARPDPVSTPQPVSGQVKIIKEETRTIPE